MKLRLLKVVVQPVFVLDSGETLTEEAANPVTVSASEWEQFTAVTFPDQIKRLQQQVEGADNE